jgi:5-methylcytosine-specific restriction endonuclease McrA
MANARQKRYQQKIKQWEHQRGLCCWCLKPMELNATTDCYPHGASWEHVIPKSLGGSDAQINRVLAGRSCNHRRGNRLGTPHFRSYTLVGQTLRAPKVAAIASPV